MTIDLRAHDAAISRVDPVLRDVRLGQRECSGAPLGP